MKAATPDWAFYQSLADRAEKEDKKQ